MMLHAVLKALHAVCTRDKALFNLSAAPPPLIIIISLSHHERFNMFTLITTKWILFYVKVNDFLTLNQPLFCVLLLETCPLPFLLIQRVDYCM